MKNKGFVLLETIVVVSMLSIILIMLYASYSGILTKVQRKSLYDNVEYLYKTSILRDYLEKKDIDYKKSSYYVICQNSSQNNKCYDENTTTDSENYIYKFLNVEAVYISIWQIDKINSNEIRDFEATTQSYIKGLDTKSSESEKFRIIAMFKQENNVTNKPIYEYASLEFGSRD